ncbi:succinate--CoA ligase [ADP-forming] subunit beta, mitochondrial-like [Typha angustifolia]|uniref:succinate--CoA ligase [ADP-forming] subunit beta, mitochondrial-like n=1 Tax=Typha angustifolia TaxID=59011 RepID=UPI003C307645
MNFIANVTIKPIAEISDKQLVLADAKFNFDNNAAFRRKEIFALCERYNIDYGLSNELVDLIYSCCQSSFLDVGQDASEGQVVEAFKTLTSDDRVKAILVNIFGGIVKCDVIASGIINAAKQVYSLYYAYF